MGRRTSQDAYQNLESLFLEPGARFLNFSIEHVVLRNAELRQVYFSGSEFHGADVSGADFAESVFHRCFLWFTLAHETCFHKADFSDAIIAQERESELEGGDFSNAIFARAQFQNLALSQARFVGNIWDGARVVRTERNFQPYLAQCILDKAAYTFFKSEGVEMIDCKKAQSSGKRASLRR